MSPLDKHPDTEMVFSGLKQVLKARGITYKELGQRMGMSEAALKNMFHQKALSLDRLSRLCDHIGLGLGELIAASGLSKHGSFELSDEHEKFFVENPHYFDFFRELVLHKKTLKQIAKENDLDKRTIFVYARGLEKLGLVEILSETNIRRKVRGRLEWRGGGPWQKRHFVKEVSSVAKTAIDSYSDPDVMLSIGAFSLSRPMLRRFYEDVSRLVSEYKNVAQKQLEVKSEKERQTEVFVDWVFTAAPRPHPGQRSKIPRL